MDFTFSKLETSDNTAGIGIRQVLIINNDSSREFNWEVYKELVKGIEHSNGFSLIIRKDDLSDNEKDDLSLILALLKSRFPFKTIWLIADFKWKLIRDHSISKYIDVMISGKHDIYQATNKYRFRTSGNQLAIDCQESLKRERMCIFL